MSIWRYFQLSAIKNGDLVTTTGREVVLRLTEGEEPKGVFVGPVLVSSEDHRANQAGYRNAKAELVTKIQAHLPEVDELICLDNKDEIVGHYKVTNWFGHEMMRIQQELPPRRKHLSRRRPSLKQNVPLSPRCLASKPMTISPSLRSS